MLKNLKIATVVASGFGTVIALMLSMGLFATWQMSQINDASAMIATSWLPSVRWVGQINNSLGDYRSAEVLYLTSRAPEDKARFEQAMASALAALKKSRDIYDDPWLISSPRERQLYDSFSKKYEAYMALDADVLRRAKGGDADAAMALAWGETGKAFDELSELCQELVDLNAKGSDNAGASSAALYQQARWTIVAAIVLCAWPAPRSPSSSCARCGASSVASRPTWPRSATAWRAASWRSR